MSYARAKSFTSPGLLLRDLERTLTAAEANALRDEIYEVLHEGSVHWWASHP